MEVMMKAQMKRFLLLASLVLGFGFAQDYSGCFIQEDDPTTVITL